MTIPAWVHIAILYVAVVCSFILTLNALLACAGAYVEIGKLKKKIEEQDAAIRQQEQGLTGAGAKITEAIATIDQALGVIQELPNAFQAAVTAAIPAKAAAAPRLISPEPPGKH